MQRYKSQLKEQQEMCERMKQQMQRLADDHRTMRGTVEQRQRELTYTKQELDRTQTRLRDTTTQLNHLVVVVEKQRRAQCADDISEQEIGANSSASADDLLLFK